MIIVSNYVFNTQTHNTPLLFIRTTHTMASSDPSTWDIGLVHPDNIDSDSNYINPAHISTIDRQDYNEAMLRRATLEQNQWLRISRDFLDNKISGQRFDSIGLVIDLLFAKPLKDLPNWTYNLHLAEGPNDITEALVYNRQDRNDEIIIRPVPLTSRQRFIYMAQNRNMHVPDNFNRYSLNVDGTDILFFWLKKDY